MPTQGFNIKSLVSYSSLEMEWNVDPFAMYLCPTAIL
jgi:hypothetical protein